MEIGPIKYSFTVGMGGCGLDWPKTKNSSWLWESERPINRKDNMDTVYSHNEYKQEGSKH